jgi:hypothetical protein
MRDSLRRSVDPRFGVNVPRSDGYRTEPAKSFRFAVTWTSVTAHLELREAAEWTSTTAGKTTQAVKHNQSSVASFAAVAVPPLIQKPETWPESSARWEMVVPKMVRADRVSQALTKAAPFTDQLRNGDVCLPISIPTFASLDTLLPPFLSRALAVIGRRTRSLLAGPAKPVDAVPSWSRLDSPRLALASGRASRLQVLQLNTPSSPMPGENQFATNENTNERHAARELLLSKIARTARGRSQRVDSTLAINHQEERWPKVPIRDEPGSPHSYEPG